MRKISWIALILIANLIVINAVLYLFINLNYPMVGHDYRLAIPSMLDTLIHFRNNGLSIQWFTPSFGGGIPAFANPNNFQFSLLGILPLWVTPWKTAILSSFFYISLGFLSSYRFFKKVINLKWEASVLGAVFFSANGFMMERMAVGHLGYQPLPALAFILVLLFDNSLPALLSGVLIGVTFALVLHQAGYFIIVIIGLSILIIFPLIQLAQPLKVNWKRLIPILLFGAFTGLLLSISKLSAVFSFMRAFPRLVSDSYVVTPWMGFVGLMMQLLGTMNLVPLLALARLDINLLPKFLNFATGANYGYWEYDMSLSPVVFAIILIGINRFFHAPIKYSKKYLQKKNRLPILFFIFSLWLSIEFTLATGWFYPILQKLPLLSSLHVNSRFAAAFLFPIAFIAAQLVHSLTKPIPTKKSTALFLLINVLTLLPLGTYFAFSADIQARIYDLTSPNQIYETIQNGKIFGITGITNNGSNTDSLAYGLSNLDLYEPIFGYNLEKFQPEIVPGSIWIEKNGYFNMTNPLGFVLPENNDTHPFERFKVKDRDKLTQFVKYHQPSWNLPLYQVICNWISGISLLIVTIFLFAYLLRTIVFYLKTLHPQ